MNTVTTVRKETLHLLLLVLAFSLLGFSNSFAQAISWDGDGGDNLWTTPTNWSGDAVPTTSNDVTINTGARVILNNTGNCASLTLGGSGNADTLIV